MRKLIIEYKFRFIVCAIFVFLLLVFLGNVLRTTYSSYVADADIDIKIEHAILALDVGTSSFEIDSISLVPSSEPYIYAFSVSNFKDDKRSEVDLKYSISLLTTTNLPLSFELYKNENPENVNATNIFSNVEKFQDKEGTWYKKSTIEEDYDLSFNKEITDIYYLKINYPITFSTDFTYAGKIEYIEVVIDTKQVID